MARSQYVESPRSSRRRKNPPPAAPEVPEVDWSRTDDELQNSPPHRSRPDRYSDSNRRDWDAYRHREARQDEEIIMRTPDSRASSSSLRAHHPEARRHRSTPSHSISSSKTSMLVNRPPLSSMTRPPVSQILYRRPSIQIRETVSAYEEDDSPPETRRSQSRPASVHMVPSVPTSRHNSRSFASHHVSESESDGEDTDSTYDSPGEEREPRRAERARLLDRTERSRSCVEPRRIHHPRRRRDQVLTRPEEDDDETDSRHSSSLDEETPARPTSRPASRAASRPPSRPASRAASRPPPSRPASRPASRSRSRSHSRSRAPLVRRIAQEPQDSVSEDSSVGDLRSRFEPPEKRKHRHKSHKREPRRRRSESHADPSPTPKRSSSKRYYDTEIVSLEKSDRHHPPSASLRRSNTVGASQAAASQHHSTWNKKFVEYSTKNRLYCVKRGCNEFIRPEDIHRADDGRKYGRCARCRTKVCVRCNEKWHGGKDCPKDEETVRFLAQAKDEGWQRCFRCKAVVELKEGCNHMTCRCGAEFCMICGSRWKTCECPWFNYDAVENDRLQHMQVPMPFRERLAGRPTVDVPGSPPRDWAVSGASPFTGLRPRPQNHDEELLVRRLQEEHDEAYARRLQNYPDYEEDHEEDYLGGYGELNGIGNAGGHHLNEDFRPRPRHITVPQAPQPPPMPAMSIETAPVFDRASTGYVQEVNRARGVGPNSLERRLADRFNSDLRHSPTHRGSATHGPPLPLPSAATIHLPAMTQPLGPASAPARRHTAEPGDVYVDDSPRPRSGGTRSVERVTASGRTTRPIVYEEPEEMMLPMGAVVRKQHIRDPPRASNLAGLTGSGRGMERVFEWRAHVEPGLIGPGPETASVSSQG